LYVTGQGWVEAGDLGIGTSIVTRAGPSLTVKNVTWQRDNTGDTGAKPFTVYNLTIADDHTYFAGDLDGGLWAHNVCAGKNHFFPRALGGGIPYGHSVLTDLNAVDHTAFHDQLNAYLKTIQTVDQNGNMVDMYPRNGNPGLTVQGNFSLQARINAVQTFMQTFKNGTYLREFDDEIDTARQNGWLR
jgi:hypothetical protein